MLSTSARDPFSTPCEKAILEPYNPVIITIQFSSPSNSHHKYPVLVVSIGIQLRVSVTVGQAIDKCFLPCTGAPTYPPCLINSGRTHFPGSCLASAKDPFSTPCEKAIPEPYYPFLISISHIHFSSQVSSSSCIDRDTTPSVRYRRTGYR